MKSTSLKTILEHTLYVEEPSKTSTNEPIANSMNQKSTRETEKRAYKTMQNKRLNICVLEKIELCTLLCKRDHKVFNDVFK